jgi:glycosyltransferase involved in cell wall biosynthesis
MTADKLNPPFFSLVIPVFNRLELVQETIQSIFEQSFRDFEIIIVDDGSNDGSGIRLDSLYSGNKLIKIIHQENLERGAARNRGFRESSGEYVVFLDSDDRLLPDHLNVLHNNIVLQGNPDFIATKYEFLSEGKRKPSALGKYSGGYYNYRLFLEGNPFGCNVCVRRGNKNISLFEEDRKLAIKEDWLFFLKNLRHQQLYLVDHVTLLMLDHENRSMRGNNDILVSKTKMAIDWITMNVDLAPHEYRSLSAHANYFCAIHKYLDSDRSISLRYLFQAIRDGGFRMKYIVLLVKIIVGRKMIKRFIHGS